MKRLIFFAAITMMIISCYREYSAVGFPSLTDTTKLPKDYPFAEGFCDGPGLGTLYPPNTDTVTTETTVVLPDSVLLDMPPAGDQGRQGSCAAWATIYAAGSYSSHEQTGAGYSNNTTLSPAYTYNQIAKGNCTCTSVIDNLNILKYQGASPLAGMAYSDTGCARQPDSIQVTEAAPFKIERWAVVKRSDTATIKRLLFEEHVLIVVIHSDAVFQQLSQPFLWKENQPSAGGLHAIAVTGYDDGKNAFRIMNSWGARWADGGFAWIDYGFFTINVAEDCYVVY